MHQFHMTRVSGNSKTGPIPVTTTSKSTCPTACPLKGNGCYAEHGPLGLHWRAVDNDRGYSLDRLCQEIKNLPKGQLWRWAQAGDLPGDGSKIDGAALRKLTKANHGRSGFGYTHYDLADRANSAAVEAANAAGFTLNASANDLAHADELAALGVAPVVTVLPIDSPKITYTPAGRAVIVCPAYTTDGLSCATCGICAVPHRKAIIGFPAHGTAKKKAQKVFMMRSV